MKFSFLLIFYLIYHIFDNSVISHIIDGTSYLFPILQFKDLFI